MEQWSNGAWGMHGGLVENLMYSFGTEGKREQSSSARMPCFPCFFIDSQHFVGCGRLYRYHTAFT